MPKRNYEKELEAIMDALAESVATASDEEVLQEARDAGEDVEGVADRLRVRLLQAMRGYRQRDLRAARAQWEQTLESIGQRKFQLPRTSEKRRALLDAVLASKPDLGGLVTAQGRELRGLADVDVEGCLRDLQLLGVLDDLPKSGEEE